MASCRLIGSRFRCDLVAHELTRTRCERLLPDQVINLLAPIPPISKSIDGVAGELMNLGFAAADQGREFFHFVGEPADLGVAMIAATGDACAVAPEERPVLRAPI